jgi:shikimate kinase
MSAPRLYRNIALIGFMGSGKSSVGHLVAAQLHFAFLDTDTLIEARAGKTISRIFAENGELTFRALESRVVSELADREKVIISTGGGLVVNEANLASLKAHALVVCLWATPEVIWRRVHHQRHRPLLQGSDPMRRIRELLAAREPYYRQADVLLNSGLRSMRQVAQQVVYHFHQVREKPSQGP